MARSPILNAALAHNVAFSYGTQIVSAVLGLISTTVILKSAGMEVYGQIATLAAIAAFSSALGSSRSNDAVVRFYTIGQTRNSPRTQLTAMALGTFLDVLLGVTIFIAVWSAGPLIASRFLSDGNMSDCVRLYALVGLGSFVRAAPYGLMIATNSFRRANLLVAIEQFVRLSVLGILLLRRADLDLFAVIIATLISTYIVTILFYVPYVRQLATLASKSRLEREVAKEFLQFTGRSFGASSLKIGSQGLDTIALGAFGGSTQVAVYNLCKQLLSPLSMAMGPVSTLVAPLFVQANAEGRSSDIFHAVRSSAVRSGVAFIVILAALTPVAAAYVSWSGVGLTIHSGLTFAIMATGSFFQFSLWWFRSFSVATKISYSIVTNGTYSAVLIVLLLPFTYFAGSAGTAAAVTVTTASIWVLAWHLLEKHEATQNVDRIDK